MPPTTRPTHTPTTQRALRPAGWVYLLHTPNDPKRYVGQTTVPVPQRVRQHRRPLDQGGQRWGHEILPGREGYTILARVESLGDPGLDAIALDLVEAEMIRKWVPSENTNRPDPQVFRDRLAAAQRGTRLAPNAPRPTAPRWAGPPPMVGVDVGPKRTPQRTPKHAPQRPTQRATQRAAQRTPTARPNRPRWALLIRLVLGVVLGVMAARVTAHTGPPWWPWTCTAVAAVLGPFGVIGIIRKIIAKATEPVITAPRRRRRRHH